jgi:hypothetical protein
VQLENRVFSASPIQELGKQFVCIKIDPRKTGGNHPAFKYKSTRSFPEVVFLHPKGKVLGRIGDRSVKGVTDKMAAVLEKMR